MTDLFDSLSYRFAPDAPIAIRPRPQSRFEGRNDAEGIVEDDSFDVVPAPEAAKPIATTQDSMRQAHPSTDTKPAMQPNAVARPKEVASKDTLPPAAQVSPNQTDAVTPQPPTETYEIHIDRPGDPAIEPVSEGAKPTLNPQRPQTPSTKPEAIREIHHENILNPAAPSADIQTRVAPTPDSAPDPAPDQAPPEPSTVVRIGRVEMRQPAPPQPAPKPPAPRRAANNTVSAGRSAGYGGGQSNGSGLTDYLGWKRR